MQSPLLGPLHKPLAVLLFHYTECTSRLSFRPSEAAFLAFPAVAAQMSAAQPNSSIPVTVLAAPSNYRDLHALYNHIPGVRLRPFRLRSSDLNVGTMLTLMAIDQSDAAPPLYMAVVTRILRDMGASAGPPPSASSSAANALSVFDYLEFKRHLGLAGLDQLQLGPLKQRLELLESFLAPNGNSDNDSSGCGGPMKLLDFAPGSVTIIDMSCPFVDANTACVMFKIGMDLFLEGGHTPAASNIDSGSTVGKVIAVDEAHKVCQSCLIVFSHHRRLHTFYLYLASLIVGGLPAGLSSLQMF